MANHAYSSCSCPLPYYLYSLVPPTITARPLPPRLAFRLQRQLRPASHGRPITTRLEQLFSSRPFIGLSTFRPISSSSTAHPRVYRTDRDIRIDIQTRLLYWSTALLPNNICSSLQPRWTGRVTPSIYNLEQLFRKCHVLRARTLNILAACLPTMSFRMKWPMKIVS